jgi:hypothetical protein
VVDYSITFPNGNKLNIISKARRGKVSVPAPAVIPALRVYMNVVGVKKHIADISGSGKGRRSFCERCLINEK